ncbi:unnamed protein product [Larinioides sclopetarius]|uniref:DUF5641 domain-containing protein n=1 Tax=Larinioides sclopetarius TaxID=280406 RepID=A0AAV2AH27_9ARAC
MGKLKVEKENYSNVLLSLHISDNCIKDLWSLDVLGIKKPCEKKTRIEMEEAARDHFARNVSRNEEGRYIKDKENWGTFVNNRVQEIRRLTNSEDWKHIAGILNPSDLPSRRCDSEELTKSLWWEGPSWFKKPREEWPLSEPCPEFEITNSKRIYWPLAKVKTVIPVLNGTLSGEESIDLYKRNSKGKNKEVIMRVIRMTCFPPRKSNKHSQVNQLTRKLLNELIKEMWKKNARNDAISVKYCAYVYAPVMSSVKHVSSTDGWLNSRL